MVDLRQQRDHASAGLNDIKLSAEALAAALKQRDGHIEIIEAVLKQRDGHIARIEAELDAANHATLVNQNHVQHLEADRGRILDLIAERDRELSQVNSTLIAVQSMAATIQTALEVSYSENRKLEQALLVSRNDADQAHDWARQVRQSASWRISAPIRWAGGLARRALKGTKATLRPLLLAGLRIARKMPWIKAPVLAAANLFPPLRRRLDHFSQVRRPLLQENGPSTQRKWNLTPDKKSVNEWESLLRTSPRHKGRSL